uniref:COG4223 family protein n=1 Tax=Roseovarius salis TaxID=3376063 RepID=UPI0037C662F9
ARAALAAARDAAAREGDTGGLTGFLRTQLGVRSLEPREGDDPDAVLSRAEAAVGQGRLTDALAEIETLPDVARAELEDWTQRARQRLDAVAAARELSEELN